MSLISDKSLHLLLIQRSFILCRSQSRFSLTHGSTRMQNCSWRQLQLWITAQSEYKVTTLPPSLKCWPLAKENDNNLIMAPKCLVCWLLLIVILDHRFRPEKDLKDLLVHHPLHFFRWRNWGPGVLSDRSHIGIKWQGGYSSPIPYCFYWLFN